MVLEHKIMNRRRVLVVSDNVIYTIYDRLVKNLSVRANWRDCQSGYDQQDRTCGGEQCLTVFIGFHQSCFCQDSHFS